VCVCVCAQELTLQLVPIKVSKEEKSKVVITMEDGSAQMSLDQVQHSEQMNSSLLYTIYVIFFAKKYNLCNYVYQYLFVFKA